MVQHFFHEVTNHLTVCLGTLEKNLPAPIPLKGLGSGKMLRSLLVQRLSEQAIESFDENVAKIACTATELVHSASLCHDDIIDQTELRRGQPTVWKQTGVPGALLVGDLLIVESFHVIGTSQLPEMIMDFANTLKTLCTAEMDQELRRGTIADEQRWRAICKEKTGSLFAFPARWSCWHDQRLSQALQRSGELLGCAYQMFDDILDILGTEELSGKSLGTDAERNKLTIPGARQQQRTHVLQALSRTMQEAHDVLAPWPNAQRAIEMYITQDLTPLFQRLLPDLEHPLTQQPCIALAAAV